MTEIVWGDPIPANGVRPEWLRDDEPRWKERCDGQSAWVEVDDSAWGYVAEIRLPADHPYYLATSKGFTYWPGGDSAPDDWDGGEILFRSGEECGGGEPFWQRGWGDADVIGYRKRTEPIAPAIAPELVERMVALLRKQVKRLETADYVTDDVTEARSIVAELEPNPVERFKRANPGLSPDELLAKALAGGAE